MDPLPAKPDRHTDRRLRREPVAWVTTVRPDGRPHVVPTWFWWDGASFLFFSKPSAVKVANVASRPDVMLAIGDPAADFDVLLVEGVAQLLDEPAATLLTAAGLDKYAAWLPAAGLDGGTFATVYSQPVRVVPTRFLPWHGRSPRGSLTRADTLGPGQSGRPAPLPLPQPLAAAA